MKIFIAQNLTPSLYNNADDLGHRATGTMAIEKLVASTLLPINIAMGNNGSAMYQAEDRTSQLTVNYRRKNSPWNAMAFLTFMVLVQKSDKPKTITKHEIQWCFKLLVIVCVEVGIRR